MISATWPVALAFQGRKPLTANNAMHEKTILVYMDKVRLVELPGVISPVSMRVPFSTLEAASARFESISRSDNA